MLGERDVDQRIKHENITWFNAIFKQKPQQFDALVQYIDHD
jgi:hypothetical protein